VECARLDAGVEASTGDVERADLEGNVTYVEDARHAWSQRARYDRGAKALTLTGGGPRIVDGDEGSELQAETIRIGTETSSISADGGVRHTIRRRGGDADGQLLGGAEPTLVVSGHLDYDPEARTARYRDNVLLRSGKDEIRAPELVLEEAEAGRRRLVATGGTSSLLHPRPRKGKEKGKDRPAPGAKASAPAPVETRSREMVYEEKAGTIVYTGDVEIHQGDIVTMSPRAVVTLTPGGDDVDRMVAGEPVEVRQGTRRATGRTGTYTLADETLVLVGDEVVLQDQDRKVMGRALTFKVGEDRIRVDGREQERTEAVFKKDTPQR
jgi:lipopolysaccharide transport protein LptA